MTARMLPPPDLLVEVCRRRHVSRLALFGSVLRDDVGAVSDVDVLVDFEVGHVPGYVRIHVLERELSRLFGGRRIDLLTIKGLNPRIRERVLACAAVQRAA